MSSTTAHVRDLAERFVGWQGAYGRPDPDRCPFVTPGPCISTQFHSPTFLAIGLYAAFDETGDVRYRDAADRYVVFFLAALCDPLAGDQRLDRPSYPFMYGMGLAAYGAFKRAHPEETLLDEKARTVFEWLLRFRWDEGSWFRNGYGFPDRGTVDCGFSEDNLNMGRGLMALHRITGDDDVLVQAEGLARYYLTPVAVGTYDGCWSDELGTWVVGPVRVGSFEHFADREAFTLGWGFTSTGTIEFLTALAGATRDDELRTAIAAVCVRSLRWQLDDCQFDDGACGLAGRDDRWLGMTAGAVLSYLRIRDDGYLSADEDAWFLPRARAARQFLVENITEDSVRAGGYLPVTGGSEPRPPENLAWMLSWVLQALVRCHELD
jgi:hypothetical protein